MTTSNVPSAASKSERLVLGLNDLIGANVRVTIADAPSGWAMASLAGQMAGVDVDDDQLMIRIGDGPAASWVVLYFDMVEHVLIEDSELEITYTAGDMTISRVPATYV